MAMSTPIALPQISYAGPRFDAEFMASLHEYGFAAVIDHPLDDERVARIYGEWLAFFSSGTGPPRRILVPVVAPPITGKKIHSRRRQSNVERLVRNF